MCRSLTRNNSLSRATAGFGAARAAIAAKLAPWAASIAGGEASRAAASHCWRPLFVALLTAVLGTSALAASARQNSRDVSAAPASEITERQGDLKSLRAQIEALRKEMANTEGSRREASDQLQDAERAISATQRELHDLTTETDRLQARLKELATQSRELEQRLNAQQVQLEKLLYRQYLRGSPDPLRLFLNGDDPNQLARDLYYLETIGRARSQILREIESTLQRKQALAVETRLQAERLLASETREKEEHARLLTQRQQRQAMLDKLAKQIAAQRREIGNLQRDEKRLTELVDRLSKIIATRAAAVREAQRRDMPRSGATAGTTVRPGPADAARPSPPGKQAAAEEPVETTAAPEARTASPAQRDMVDLARLKGQLRLPTRGAVSNRFGTVRQEGSTWKGVFIGAATGSEVRSIAGGRVVFAEWMRGFGNLLIVDHGNGYLSIYANNDSLRRQVGDEVRAGETIATVGNSGGNPESGLYFELRHQGKPLDPLAWVSAK